MTESLFEDEASSVYQPLAARMRPQTLDQYMGQSHLLAPGRPLREAIESGHLHSMIFWGPPGVGKTTLAKLLAEHADAKFQTLSAVLSGVKEIRAAVEQAKQWRHGGHKTVLFVDEVHRFNKSQQDAFLPFVEDGTFIFVGATTENPSFELNSALLSRARVYVLKSFSVEELTAILRRCLEDETAGLASRKLQISDEQLEKIALAADGDGRKAINLLEVCNDLAEESSAGWTVSDAVVTEALTGLSRRFDKQGENFYDQISALHKSMRGSDPDATLYWFARMLDGGCDPLYIARRVVRMASEDVGNADPRGLTLALDAWEVQERLGSPEGELAIAQALVYLASAPKSNAVYKAFNAAKAYVQNHGSDEVPLHLRNAPTKLMKELGYGNEYRYAHDEPDGFAAGENYLPAELANDPQTEFYQPVPRGLEKKIAEKLEYLKQLNHQAPWKRYQEDEPSQ